MYVWYALLGGAISLADQPVAIVTAIATQVQAGVIVMHAVSAVADAADGRGLHAMAGVPRAGVSVIAMMTGDRHRTVRRYHRVIR